jgi:hypothetical protein
VPAGAVPTIRPMGRALGVWCKNDEVMLALADNGALVEDSHERLKAPALFEQTESLRAVLDDVGRVLMEVRPDVVRVLLPEQTYNGSYASLAPRAALETLVRLAAANADIELELLHRNSARARVGMPRRGRFEDHIPSVIPEPIGRYWATGRRLAAVAAIAEAK